MLVFVQQPISISIDGPCLLDLFSFVLLRHFPRNSPLFVLFRTLIYIRKKDMRTNGHRTAANRQALSGPQWPGQRRARARLHARALVICIIRASREPFSASAALVINTDPPNLTSSVTPF